MATAKTSLFTRSFFVFDFGFLFAFLTMVGGEKMGYLMTGTPPAYILLGFVVGLLIGTLLLHPWDKKLKGLNRELITGLVFFLNTAFFAMVGLVVGMTLGGNGILLFDFAGLGGYESVGLLFGVVTAFLGVWVSMHLYFQKAQTKKLLVANGVLMLLCLLIGDQLPAYNLVSLTTLLMPALTMLLRYGLRW